MLLLLGRAREGYGFGEHAVVAAGDGGGEERELLVGYAGDFFGVFAHARLVGVDYGEPELGVGAAEGDGDVAVESICFKIGQSFSGFEVKGLFWEALRY